MRHCLSFFPVFMLLSLACQQSTQTESSDTNLIKLAEFIYEEAPFPECHASTVAEASDGTLVAAWFGGTEEKNKDVGIWFSRKENNAWTNPIELANGIQNDTLRYPCWNPVLFQPTEGPLQLYYKVGPNPREWWGMVISSEDDGKSWSVPRVLGDSLIGAVKNKPIELADGSLLAPSSTEHAGWVVHLERSIDGGQSWTRSGPLNDPKTFGAIQPTLLTYADGRIQMLCRGKQGYVTTSWSSDQGFTWSPMEETLLPNPNSGIDGVTLHDGRQLLVYNPTQPPEGEWGGERTPLVVGISEDGENWEEIATLEDEAGEYSYPSVIQSPDGKVHIVYTWKRIKVKHVVIGF